MNRRTGGPVLDGNNLVIGQGLQTGIQPEVPEDVRRWMEDGLIDAIDLGSARDKNVPQTTWHHNMYKK